MSYTINPNAKNKWARNAENTMDLSLETDASSVYLDNGRTLEQELGKGSMVSNVATVDNAMSKVIDGTLDGAYESCVFKGKSLVNLMTNCKDEYVVRYHDPSNPNYTVANISMMKPNTEYTLFYKAKYRTEGDGAGEVGTLHIATSVEQGFIGASHNLTTEYKQYVFKLTTTSTVDCFTFKSNGSYFAIKECVLLEGDYTNQDVPFFEGLCDVKMPILRNVGKNLYGGEVITNKAIDFNIGELYDAEGYNALNYYTPVSQGSTITISNEYGKLGANTFIFYDSNKEYTGFINVNGVATIPKGVCYVRAYGMSHIMMGSIQIEEGSTATTYEDHKTNILRTSEEIVLREVNGVQDTYNPLTGEYIKRTGEIVLNGSQQVMRDGSLLFFALKDVPENNFSISDRLPSITIGQIINGVTGVGVQDRGTGGRLYINISDLSTEEEITQYLQNTPVTVQYKLVKPVTSIVESLTTPFAYQNGHIILESGYEGQSLLPTLEYSTVVNKTGLVENVAKTIQRQEKQLTMLEKMLIQNIINLDYNNTLLTLKNEMEEML